jgi:hypothetical protein
MGVLEDSEKRGFGQYQGLIMEKTVRIEGGWK